ncbi:MAG TPA: AAA family ATPase [Symbiobacteriaceae bacterium]|nr:AAA family ATPase [Symbiobacteriaceae bacterium]
MVKTRPLVGRQREATEFQHLLDEAAHGAGGLVLIGGEAGIGKTALLSAVLDEARDRGLTVRTGRCPGPGETPPFGPWLELAAAPHSGLPRPFGDGPQAGPAEIAAGLLALLGQNPAVLALEDIHWADPATLDLLKHVCPRLAGRSMLVVATYRSDEVHRAHPLWALLPELQRTGARRMLLDRLAPDDVSELTTLLLGPDESDAARRLYERTEGHPLFLCELLEAADRTGTIPGESDPLPETVQQALDSRLARLSAMAQSVLQVAAIIGERFPYDLLLQVAGLPEDDVLTALEQAVALHVIADEHDRFAFTHALLREALVGRLIGPRRRHWHRRIAETLVASPRPDTGAIARHLSRAGDPKAPAYLMEAGDQALHLGALVQAGELYEQALETLPDTAPLRAELLLKLGFTLRYSELSRARAYWEEALKAPGERAVLVWIRYHLLIWRFRPDEPAWHTAAANVLAEQKSLLGNPDYHRLEQLLCGSMAKHPRIIVALAQALMAAGQMEQADELLKETLAGLPPDSERNDLLRVQWELEWYVGRRTRALAIGRQLMDSLLRAGFYHAAIAWGWRQFAAMVVTQADRPDEIDALAEWVMQAEADVVNRTGYPFREGFSTMGYWQFLRGDWAGAYRHRVEFLRQNPADLERQTRKEAVLILLCRGEWAEAREILSTLYPRHPDEELIDIQLGNVWVPIFQARYHLATGAPDQARVWLEAGERYIVRHRLEPDRASLLIAWADYHFRTGNLKAAAEAAGKALPLAIETNDCLDIIRAKRLLGSAGPVQEASGWFDQAQALAEQCRFPYEAALVQLARGQRLAGAPGALEGLRQARETFARLGAAPALAEAEAALEQGLRASLPDGLTEREAEVVRLVAQGLTDKEIGARLFISPKTVDGHLRNIFNKVGVSSRTALATYAARHGLL